MPSRSAQRLSSGIQAWRANFQMVVRQQLSPDRATVSSAIALTARQSGVFPGSPGSPERPSVPSVATDAKSRLTGGTVWRAPTLNCRCDHDRPTERASCQSVLGALPHG